mgnify:CR=1 FL=1
MMNLPSEITICEVGLRDGLQNEKTIVSTEDKLSLLRDLVDAGFPVIEVGSFMHPKKVPQMADTDDLFKALEVENIIECGYLSAVASKERKETRWYPWHFRTDYPERNDREWKKHVVLTRGDGPDDVRVTYKDVIKMAKGGEN